MKTDLHPKYNENIKITCTCGNIIIAGSTKESLKTEICSACHPFYTGQQKLVDTAGRVDKYMEKVRRAQKIKEKQVKTVDKELDDMFEEEKPVKKEVKEPPKKEAKKAQPAKKPARKTAAKSKTAGKSPAKKSKAK